MPGLGTPIALGLPAALGHRRSRRDDAELSGAASPGVWGCSGQVPHHFPGVVFAISQLRLLVQLSVSGKISASHCSVLTAGNSF